MSSPSGVAAIEGLSVGQERKLLQLPRKFEAGSHMRADGQPFDPFTFYVKAGDRWMTAAELTLAFRHGQRMKTRLNKARKAKRRQIARKEATEQAKSARRAQRGEVEARQATTTTTKSKSKSKSRSKTKTKSKRQTRNAASQPDARVVRRSKRRRTHVEHYSK